MGSSEESVDIDHQRRIKNPVTGNRVALSDLPETGYKYRYLKLLREHRKLKGRIQNAVELEGKLNFDKDKWELQQDENAYFLIQKEWDSGQETMELLTYWKEGGGL